MLLINLIMESEFGQWIYTLGIVSWLVLSIVLAIVVVILGCILAKQKKTITAIKTDYEKAQRHFLEEKEILRNETQDMIRKKETECEEEIIKIKTYIENRKTELDKMDNRTLLLNVMMALDGCGSRISGVEEVLKKSTGDIQYATNQLSNVANEFLSKNPYDEWVAEVKNELEGIRTDLVDSVSKFDCGELCLKVNDLSNDIDIMSSNLDELSADLGELSSNIDELSSDVNCISGNIDSINYTLNDSSDRIYYVADVVDSISDSME